MSEEKKIRVFIADDHPFLRLGIKSMVDSTPDMICCGEAENVSGTMKGLEATKPDLLLLDLCLGDGDGLEMIKAVRALHEELPVLILSQLDETLYAERALRAGANGYIMKERATNDVLDGIRTLMEGDFFVSKRVAALAVRRMVETRREGEKTEVDALSDREIQVFRLLGTGKGTRDIAESLGLSYKTIETYRENIKHKLGLPDASALVHRATEWLQGQTRVARADMTPEPAKEAEPAPKAKKKAARRGASK
ncbi:MAG: response regulator transcription factor [Verrucomicrobiae bacterium]|jgi:DNA-binding NarL/FixJ family response regulator|nr:response regulator transcription factor [Verrucomicrobiae bacterium]